MESSQQISFQLTSYGKELEVRASTKIGEARQLSIPTDINAAAMMASLPFDPAGIDQAGENLYKTLVGGQIKELVQEVFRVSERNPVSFELRFDPDQGELARLPWELICDEYGRFLVRDGLVDLTRYISYPRRPPILNETSYNTGLLQVIASPQDLQPLSKVNIPHWIVDQLDHASFEMFMKKLLFEREDRWGLHFDGHGGYLPICPQCNHLSIGKFCAFCRQPGPFPSKSCLAFEKDGKTEWVTAKDFGAAIYNANIQFALLLACETCMVRGSSLFDSGAPGLILAGVPAVIGMQAPISDKYASAFLENFYIELYKRRDYLAALRFARQAIRTGEWYVPCIYLRHQKTELSSHPIYGMRKFDTAVPKAVKAGEDFLVKAWLRKPETPAQTRGEIGADLGVGASMVKTASSDAEVKFIQGPDRKLRRGEVEIRLFGARCEIQPASVKIFVSENLDAPAAYFVVRALQTGTIPLVFSLWQDGAQIAGVAHPIQVSVEENINTDVEVKSFEVQMEAVPFPSAGPPTGAYPPVKEGDTCSLPPPASQSLGQPPEQSAVRPPIPPPQSGPPPAMAPPRHESKRGRVASNYLIFAVGAGILLGLLLLALIALFLSFI